MFYKEYAPPPSLAKYIKCFWILECPVTEAGFSREKILPDGCMELILHYGDHFNYYLPDGSFVQQPRSFFHGQLKQFIEIGPTGKVGMIAVRFYPHGAAPFLQVPAGLLTDQYISVFDILGKASVELEDKIGTAANPAERLEIIRQFLLKRLQNYRQKNTALVEQSLNLIRETKGTISVSQLSKHFQISARHLEDKFVESVGISPKLLLRIERFQHTLHLIQTQKSQTLTELALSAGYYDQSHFIRDFREFAGVSPRKYFKDTYQMADLFY